MEGVVFAFRSGLRRDRGICKAFWEEKKEVTSMDEVT
jgi:hypothetical protein